jgi:hypothetical protein
MAVSSKLDVKHLAKAVIALAPCIMSMFTLYWLEYGEVWTTATPHRGKSSVIILMIGMGLSFLLYCRLFKHHK